MFPWQSGSDGRDETPILLFNSRSGRWIPDGSRFQRHVGLAIAYDVWQHWQVTGDPEYLGGPGGELLLEVARFFVSLAQWDEELGRYRIAGVVGPDEFHDRYPWSADPGVVDNAYTNVMASWLLWRAGELVQLLAEEQRSPMVQRLGVDAAEIARWERVSRNLHVPFHAGVISQFAGFERLEPFDLDAFRRRHGDIGRLDLILDAEGDAVRRYQVSKQADVLMLLYLLSAEELREVLERMGYPLTSRTIRATVDYYAARRHPRVDIVTGGARLGSGSRRSRGIVAVLSGGAGRGRDGWTGWHHPRRHSSRGHGRHCRHPATLLCGARGAGRGAVAAPVAPARAGRAAVRRVVPGQRHYRRRGPPPVAGGGGARSGSPDDVDAFRPAGGVAPRAERRGGPPQLSPMALAESSVTGQAGGYWSSSA